MVSTRGHHHQQKYKFSDGEKVLCYEPDPTKAKVLYDSKVREVSEGKDRRGRRIVEYLIHFQGWNPSWDRKVSEDFILKDTEENRQLQKDLAEKSQLHQGAYLYRKERKKPRVKSFTDRPEGSLTGAKLQHPVSSEEGSSCSNGFGKDEQDYSVDDMEECYSSSVESIQEEDKVYLKIGDKMRRFLEYDYVMIHDNWLVHLPAKVPIVSILEDFVRYYTIRQLFDIGQEQTKSRRRNSTAPRITKDYEQIRTNVELCKEVADGLRLYFDFTLEEYLLYKQEKPQAEIALSPESLCNFTYISMNNFSMDLRTLRANSPTTEPGYDNGDSSASTSFASSAEERRTRRLRSHKNEENEFILDLTPIRQDDQHQSSDGHLPIFNTSINILRTAFPSNVTISRDTKEILDDVFHWNILPTNAPPEPSMIYGGIHLTRLILKLPEFLSATNMMDDKLKMLLKFLDDFAEFVEANEDWFDQQCYVNTKEECRDTSYESLNIKDDMEIQIEDGILAGSLLSDVKVEMGPIMS